MSTCKLISNIFVQKHLLYQDEKNSECFQVSIGICAAFLSKWERFAVMQVGLTLNMKSDSSELVRVARDSVNSQCSNINMLNIIQGGEGWRNIPSPTLSPLIPTP